MEILVSPCTVRLKSVCTHRCLCVVVCQVRHYGSKRLNNLPAHIIF